MLTPKEKISEKGHFIDDSNEYKYVFVPSEISGEKNIIFDERWVFNFFPRKSVSEMRFINVSTAFGE